MKIIEKFLDLVYPPNIYCLMCGSVIDKTRRYSLCDNCIEKFMWVRDRTCEKCGKILEENYTKSLCPDCLEREHYFDKGYTCAKYGLYERSLIVDFKKGDKSYIGRILGEILYDRIVIENLPVDVIISVPVHKKKLKQRGYNQAEIMAYELARRMDICYRGDFLLRKKKTVPMKRLGAMDRMINLSGAFEVNPDVADEIQGKNILIVDDIYTTGATVDQCSKILKENHAKKVYVLTFAAGSIMVK